jgi:hypothetical protein
MSTFHDAASFVRSRLQAMGARVSQDQMQDLVKDLKVAMGRSLTAADVNAVVAAFQEIVVMPHAAMIPMPVPQASAPSFA